MLAKSRQEDISLPPWSSINQILMLTTVLPLEYIIDQKRLNFNVNIPNIENRFLLSYAHSILYAKHLYPNPYSIIL